MHVLFEGNGYIVAEKPAGLLSEAGGGGKESFLDTLQEGLSADRGEIRNLFPVHRLDRAVGGVMVYATEKQTAARLSVPRAVQKYYLAVVKGRPENCGTYRDFLYKDPKTNKTFPVKSPRKGVREAALRFQTLQTTADGAFSLVVIALETGRSHQIRAQFSSRKHPVVGDGKYGGGDNAAKNLALFSFLLAVPRCAGAAFSQTTETLSAPSSFPAANALSLEKTESFPVLRENCDAYCCFPPRAYPWTLFSESAIASAKKIVCENL